MIRLSRRAAIFRGVARSRNYLRLTTVTNLVETGHSGGGYDYTPSLTISGYNPTAAGYPTSSLQSNTDGWVAMTVPEIGSYGPIIGFTTTQTPTTFSDLSFAIYADSASPSYLYIIDGVSSFGGPPDPTPVFLQMGDIMRVRRTGSTGYLEVSKDGGTTFIVANSFSVNASSQLKPFVQTGSSDPQGTILAPYASDSVA